MNFKKCLLVTLSSIGVSCFVSGCGDHVTNYYGEFGSSSEEGNGSEEDNPSVVVDKTDKTENTEARCSDGIDNDNSGKSDCDDPNCTAFLFCAKAEEGKENTLDACKDSKDNDGDGKIDCDDEECQAFAICAVSEDENTAARCQDGLDNDKNGKIDCDDAECKIFPFCTISSDKLENTLAACTDGIDNDDDGDLDCLDKDCQVFDICKSVVGVKENTRELCSDGLDNDFNGVADDKDPNCALFANGSDGGGAYGETYESCKNKSDVDGDGKKGCDDPECINYDICMNGFSADNDECPDDPFAFKKDATCGCGKTNIDGVCYTNIGSEDEFFSKIALEPNGKFIIKQPIDLGETDHAPITEFSGVLDGGGHRITGVLNQDVSKRDLSQEERCSDNIDNDNNGKTDCDDSYCAGLAFCAEAEDDKENTLAACEDGKDNDKDGKIDCEDEHCQDLAICAPVACGLFGRLTDNPDVTFKNIDLAITLNCTGVKGSPLAAGGLAAELRGNANHITGSSKVYAEIVDYTSKKSYFPTLDRDIGGLFGNTNYKESNISDIKLRGNVSAYYYTYINVKRMRDRIGGLVGAGNVLRNIDADVNVTLNSRNPNPNTWIRTFVGGVAGRASLLDRVHSRGYIKQVGEELTNNYVDWAFTAGVAGYINEGASNVSFDGIIEVSGFPVSLIAEQKKYTPSSGSTRYYDPWIGYGKDYTSGNEEAYSHPKNYGNHIGGIAAVLGSVVEGDFKASEYDENTKIFKAGIEQAVVDADFYVIANNASVGGILGSMLNTNTFVRNSSANIGMTFLRNNETRNNETNVTRSCYYGGIVGLTIGESNNLNPVSYVINNSARTRHYANNGQLNNEELSIGGITGGTYGILVNNFASDTIYCGESCAYSLSAVKGAYVYESYWNKDVVGTNSGAYYSDASAQSYTYNASGIPVTHTQDTVLGLLRYNAGYDGGVLSAHIPANADGKYTDWTTTIDEEGHVIPVPDIN